MSQENVHIIRSMYETFAPGDIPAVRNALNPQVEYYGVVGGQGFRVCNSFCRTRFCI